MILKQEFNDILEFSGKNIQTHKEELIAYIVYLITKLVFKSFTSNNKWKLSKAILVSPLFIYNAVVTIWKIAQAYFKYISDAQAFNKLIYEYKKNNFLKL